MATHEQDFSTEAPSFQIGDIYYTLFRHKWKILSCWLLAFAAAFAFYKLNPSPYVSEAKLLIKYVVTEGKSMGPGHDESVVKTTLDQRGETIIKSELEILSSLDLAEEVAKSVGADKILGPSQKKSDVGAALLVQQNLFPELAPNSTVIRLTYYHSDPLVAQAVLREVVNLYLKRHVEIHLTNGGVADAMTAETDQLRSQLAQTEEELRKVMSSAGIISLEDSKKANAEQITRIRQQVYDAQAELAGRVSILQETTQSPTEPGSVTSEKEYAAVPPEQLAAYQKIAVRLAALLKREQDLLAGGFSEESTRVTEARTRIAEAQEQKKKLETDFPGLMRVQVVVPNAPNQQSQASTTISSPQMEAAQIAALKAKIKALTGQLDEVRSDTAKIDKLEANIMELRRRKELQETNYRNISQSLEASRINDALGTGRAPNIIQIETPTPPLKSSKKTYKIIFAILGIGFAAGLAWAFAIELYFDRSIRRPADIERTLRLPLFLSIPKLGGGDRTDKNQKLLPGPAGARGAGESSQLSLMPGGSELALNPYYETLRDRLISYFETLNVRHKPKLVAVTGLGKDTGVTTLAAGLARSFSETGEGNVLLVDMTQGQGSAQHFHKGATVVGLEQLLDTKQSAQVQDNLYVVSENSNSDRLAKGMPQRFNQLIPKLKASDFDYIIFDMPPINQISVTPRLASFMDMMLMVIESEKTDRDVALQASAMLAKSKAPVGVVLNKAKSYVPPALHQDRDSLLGT